MSTAAAETAAKSVAKGAPTSPIPTIDRVVARGIVKAYGSTMALRGVDAILLRAQLTLIEGANGSGKSTLLGILGTGIRPTAGTVLYEPLGDNRVEVRAAIGWVSHETLAYPDLSGRQNVELVARLHGFDAAEAWTRAEERFELGTFAKRPLRTCSRGQRQRVALARALIHEPSLVLLDEPDRRPRPRRRAPPGAGHRRGSAARRRRGRGLARAGGLSRPGAGEDRAGAGASVTRAVNDVSCETS